MSYTVDYSGQSPVQAEAAFEPAPSPVANGQASKRGFRIPSILKTTAVFLTGAAALFTWETVAPEGYRVSTFMGTYEARVAAAVKAAELQQQSRYEAWAGSVKIAAEQNAEQYKALTQGVLSNYSATYDRAKIMAQAATQMQSNYLSVVMNQKASQQGGDTAIISFTRMIGRGLNALESGAGDAALNYSHDLSNELTQEMADAARAGARTDIVGWDTGLATPDQVRATIMSIEPLRIPPPPSIGEAATSIGDRPEGAR